eukprot:scaffold256543_cov27-Tisochrysis_lutea.AAC.1
MRALSQCGTTINRSRASPRTSLGQSGRGQPGTNTVPSTPSRERADVIKPPRAQPTLLLIL